MTDDMHWYAVDLDGTLAYYDHWRGLDHIGAPIPEMVERVKSWVAEGKLVKVMTARMDPVYNTEEDIKTFLDALEKWTVEHIGVALSATSSKDYFMVALYDDRAVGVEHNTGRLV